MSVPLSGPVVPSDRVPGCPPSPSRPGKEGAVKGQGFSGVGGTSPDRVSSVRRPPPSLANFKRRTENVGPLPPDTTTHVRRPPSSPGSRPATDPCGGVRTWDKEGKPSDSLRRKRRGQFSVCWTRLDEGLAKGTLGSSFDESRDAFRPSSEVQDGGRRAGTSPRRRSGNGTQDVTGNLWPLCGVWTVEGPRSYWWYGRTGRYDT